MEIDGLIEKGVFRFKMYDPIIYGGYWIFKARMVNEIKGKGTGKEYEKS